MDKVCCRCGELKPLEDFVKNSNTKTGFGCRCKACHRIASKESTKRNPELRKAATKRYYENNKEKVFEANERWRLNNLERWSEYRIAYRTENIERTRERRRARYELLGGDPYQKRIRKEFPDAYKARCKVNNSVASGLLPRVKTLRCCQCGRPATSYHHHNGYDEPHWLDVVPMCHRCHREADLLIWLKKKALEDASPINASGEAHGGQIDPQPPDTSTDCQQAH